MARKRLTTATLQDSRRTSSSERAADLAFKLLGPAASDKELIVAGSNLLKGLGEKRLGSLHAKASRIAQETGEDFPGPSENEGPPQPEPENSQEYVTEHVAAPDHVVLDTVVNKSSPSVDPTASRRRAAEEDDSSDDDGEDLTASLTAADDDEGEEITASADDDGDDVTASADDDEGDDVTASRRASDDDEPDMEDPEDLEGDDGDFVEDEYEDMGEDEADMEEEDLDDPEEDYDSSEPGLDEFMDDGDDDFGGSGSTSSDQGGSEDYYDNYTEDDGEFTTEDLNSLQDLGVEQIPGVMSSKKKRRGSRAASKKKNFRPSRTRTAGKSGHGDEFESVFGTPDLGDMFLN